LIDPSVETNRYLNNERTRYVHLIDGGVSDNLALRGAGGTMQTIAQAPESLGTSGLNRIRRVLVLSIDGREPRIRALRSAGSSAAFFPSSVWSPAPRSTGSTSRP
jgi:hypothetical protein